MVSKAVLLLAAASLVKDTVAANAHRHAHLHEKRAIVTETAVVTDWVTVTAGFPEGSSTAHPVFVADHHSHGAHSQHSSSPAPPASSSSSSSAPAPAAPSSSSSSTSAVAAAPTTSTTPATTAQPSPTTLSTVVSSSTSNTLNVQVAAVASSSKAATSSTAANAGSYRRGLGYNDGTLLSSFLSSGTKCDWKYNWGQVDDSTSVNIEFVPMLWGTSSDHTSSWSTNANNAITAGSTYLLSFNEPDLASQANLSPADAASAHIQYMGPFSGKAKIGSPAITNSPSSTTATVGIDWLSAFITACDGKCPMDFVAIHWYNLPNATEFVEHAKAVYAVAQKPIWVTEFAPVNADADQIGTFLQDLFKLLDSDSSLAFIERIAYFMVATNNLVTSGTTLSSYGQIYAYTA